MNHHDYADDCPPDLIPTRASLLERLKDWSAKDVAKTLGVTIAHVCVAKHRISNLIRKEVAALEAKEI